MYKIARENRTQLKYTLEQQTESQTLLIFRQAVVLISITS